MYVLRIMALYETLFEIRGVSSRLTNIKGYCHPRVVLHQQAVNLPTAIRGCTRNGQRLPPNESFRSTDPHRLTSGAFGLASQWQYEDSPFMLEEQYTCLLHIGEPQKCINQSSF
ncbi:unnamed protein product [Pieris macdunnoughi]|uniref:Uncharacterized protein n=1 Tax=Pieris macdunnoughi TaxID=345717 RepID=A0A821SLH6_9NEOP|nr:unnamed protein product [Pieris macdunnoughi]